MQRLLILPLLTAALLTSAAQPASSTLIPDLNRALSTRDARRIKAIETDLLSTQPPLDDLLSAGALLGQHDLIKDSAAIFERCVTLYPNSFEAHYNLAFARLNLGQLPEASRAIASITPSSAADQAASQYLQGKIFQASGDMQKAHDNLASAYRARPQEENYALDLALFYLHSSAYVPAIDVLQSASTYHPESQEIKLELALANALAGRNAAALTLCRNLQAKPTTASLSFLIAAFAQCMSQDFRACSQQARLGLNAPHPHPYLYYLDATALWNMGSPDPTRVLRDLNEAIARLPNCTVCLDLRAKVFEKTGNPNAALADLNTIVAQAPQSASAWYRLAQLDKKLGRAADSAAALRRYQAIHTTQTNQDVETFRQQFLGNNAR